MGVANLNQLKEKDEIACKLWALKTWAIRKTHGDFFAVKYTENGNNIRTHLTHFPVNAVFELLFYYELL